jgi:putative transposase
MTNHIHLIAVPGREDSLSVLLRRVHGSYAQYYNVRAGRTGHLWQNRFFACVLEASHLWTALAYVERNPVRAAMVSLAEEYLWSSAAAHLSGEDPSGLLDTEWWRRETPPHWREILNGPQLESDRDDELRACTYAGRPYGPMGSSATIPSRVDRPSARKSTVAVLINLKKQATQIRMSPWLPLWFPV